MIKKDKQLSGIANPDLYERLMKKSYNSNTLTDRGFSTWGSLETLDAPHTEQREQLAFFATVNTVRKSVLSNVAASTTAKQAQEKYRQLLEMLGVDADEAPKVDFKKEGVVFVWLAPNARITGYSVFPGAFPLRSPSKPRDFKIHVEKTAAPGAAPTWQILVVPKKTVHVGKEGNSTELLAPGKYTISTGETSFVDAFLYKAAVVGLFFLGR